jgi:hypothetical protein
MKLELNEAHAFITYRKRVANLNDALFAIGVAMETLDLKGNPAISVLEHDMNPEAHVTFMIDPRTAQMNGGTDEDEFELPQRKPETHYLVTISGEINLPTPTDPPLELPT